MRNCREAAGRGLGALALSVLMSSCASFTTSTKSVDFARHSVALDVKQRVVISQQHPSLSNRRVVCAEPNPDALSVIGTSAGATFNNNAGTSAGLSAALAESGAYVGLRTQSIQLLRDAMFRLCEGYAAGAVYETEFSAMQRRYQSTMMGLIAIEQLTGPVVASQALLLTSADAKTGSPAGDAAVAAAQTRVQTATEAALAAQTETDKSALQLATIDTKVADAQKQLNAARSRDPVVQSEIDSLSGSLATLQQERKTAELDLADKRRRLEAANENRRVAIMELNQAKTGVAASAAGTGNLNAVAVSTAQSNAALTAAVVGIVREINNSYLRDACLTLITELVNRPDRLTALDQAVASAAPSDKTQPTTQSRVAPAEVLITGLGVCRELLAAEQARISSQSSPEAR